jgi:hypothetical protein
VKTNLGAIARRWSVCYRIAAVLLLILIATPFTAPFSTCDADIVLDTSVSDDHDAKKLDSATRLSMRTITIVEPVSTLTPGSPSFSLADTPGPAVFALRL